MRPVLRTRRTKIKPIGVCDRPRSALLPVLLLIGQLATVLPTSTWADWTPPEASVSPPAVLTVNTFAPQDLSGAMPESALVAGPDGALYGSTLSGGAFGHGTLFRVSPNGGFSKLHDFNGIDGGHPQAALVLGLDGTLYGSTGDGGAYGAGILFRLETNGSFTKLHDFNGSDGEEPFGALVVGPNGALYGSTMGGGSYDTGTLFKLETNGAFTTLHEFSNDGGSRPMAALTARADGYLYGSTQRRSGDGPGTLFKVATDGTLTHLHNVNAGSGRFPQASMVVGPDDALYGTTPEGGPENGGVIFKLVLPPILKTPAIAWANPANIVEGTPLGGTQLNATASFNGVPVAGTFTYNPTAGTVLPVGNGQTLSAAFTPSDTIHYTAASASVSIKVIPVNHPPFIGNSLPDSITSPFGFGFYYGPAANTFIDPDAGQTLTYSATGMPPGITFDPVTFSFSGVSEVPGEFVVTLTATDNGTPPLSAQASMRFILTRLGQATDFNPNAGGTVFSTAVQPDGKTVIGGGLNTVGGAPRIGVARLNADGTLDTAFNPNVNSFTYTTALQADGKILFGGQFSAVGGTGRSRMARLNADGTLDVGFNPNVNGNVASIAVQTDGRIVIGGHFNTVGGIARNRIALLYSTGALAPIFNPNANDGVHNLALQADGQILVGGQFTTLGGQPRNRFARLFNDPASQTLTVPSEARVQWLRGGTAPETTCVTFELSTDWATWTMLGSGARIGGGWELIGLNLPAAGVVRARARTCGGQYNGSSGQVEQTSTFGGFPPFRHTPIITWANPADILEGTPLSGAQLNAAASFNGTPVPGTFTYNPPAGTVLPAGNGQTLSAVFVPDDSVHVASASASVSINVRSAVPAIASLNPASAVANGPAFTLAVNGQSFDSGSVVYWNGTARLTTYYSPSQLASLGRCGGNAGPWRH